MKKMRFLFLALALSLGWCAGRAQGQTIAQTMTFSVICQYVTNTYTTNGGIVSMGQHLNTVALTSANIVRAIAADVFGTGWTNWESATLFYEENMTNGNQGIFLYYKGNQTNVSRYFTSSTSTNGFANMFSKDVPNVFGGTIYPTLSSNSYVDLVSQDPINPHPETNFPGGSLPLSGVYGYGNGPVATAYDDLAYVTLTTRNTSFTLFGYSQGNLFNAIYDQEGHVGIVDAALIAGAGTFSLNLTSNLLFITNGYPLSTNITPRGTNIVLATNVVLATNLFGVAHGTLTVGTRYRLAEGP
jgi:hypothetical protein